MKNSVLLFIPIALLAVSCSSGSKNYGNKIDRKALVERNNPHVTAIDTQAALSVGNGSFCFTVDATGLQTLSKNSTEASWGWHNYPNLFNVKPEKMYDAAGKLIPVSKKNSDVEDARRYFQLNEHRLNLGQIGFKDVTAESISGVDQVLDMWNGAITSNFSINGKPVKVVTTCDPAADMLAASISSEEAIPVAITVAYPEEAIENNPDMAGYGASFGSELRSDGNSAVILVKMNATRYSIRVNCENSYIRQPENNVYEIVPTAANWGFTAEFAPGNQTPAPGNKLAASQKATAEYWNDWWQVGGAVDFSACTDSRAAELERRVVLSQYLTGIQCADACELTGSNAAYGKIDADNVWWETAPFALYGHPEQLSGVLAWYNGMLENATAAAKNEEFSGARWASLTGIDGIEYPSEERVGRISQQPQVIYLLDLLERAGVDVSEYSEVKDATLKYMEEVIGLMGADSVYSVKGIPMQGRQLKTAEQPAFEAAYWFYALNKHQQDYWRYAQICKHYAPLAVENGAYLCALKDGDESAEGHPAVLAALGMLPATKLVDEAVMKTTLEDVLANWDWNTASGADFAMTAMCATRLGEPQKAIDALLMDVDANKYLVNGQNSQNDEINVSLAGNGGILSAVALMCAGWDGCSTETPGFANVEGWNVRWEKINPLP